MEALHARPVVAKLVVLQLSSNPILEPLLAERVLLALAGLGVPAARTKMVDGLLLDCAGTGRVFGVRIGLPDWNNVLAMPGHPFA